MGDGILEEEIIAQPSIVQKPEHNKYDDNSPLKWWMIMVPIAVVIAVVVAVLGCYWIKMGLEICSKADTKYEAVPQKEIVVDAPYGTFTNAYDDDEDPNQPIYIRRTL